MKMHKVEQRSPEWQQLRKGVITGTTLKQIVGGPKAYESALYEIIGERLTEGLGPEEYENDMDRGNRLEPDAIAMFELETGKVVTKAGFLESDRSKFIGQSPDGMVGETEAVEVKCPAAKNHIRIWLTDQVPATAGCDYEDQVTQYFAVNEKLETLYFVSYNPEIPVHPLHVVTVTRASISGKIAEAQEKMQKFLLDVEERIEKIIKLD